MTDIYKAAEQALKVMEWQLELGRPVATGTRAAIESLQDALAQKQEDSDALRAKLDEWERAAQVGGWIHHLREECDAMAKKLYEAAPQPAVQEPAATGITWDSDGNSLVNCAVVYPQTAAPRSAVQEPEGERKERLSQALTKVFDMATQPEVQKKEKVEQWRKQGTGPWWDGYPDHSDGAGPYETRTVYAAPQPTPFAGLTVKVRGSSQTLNVTGVYGDTVFVDLPVAEADSKLQQRKNIALMQTSYACGWSNAAIWAGREDLISDIGSFAYMADMKESLKNNFEYSEKK